MYFIHYVWWHNSPTLSAYVHVLAPVHKMLQLSGLFLDYYVETMNIVEDVNKNSQFPIFFFFFFLYFKNLIFTFYARKM